MFDLHRLAVLNYGNDSELQALHEQLTAAGYEVLELRGEPIRDGRSLFNAVSKDLLQGEPVENWSGLNDSLRNALLERRTDKIALVWTHVHQMLDGALPDLVTVLDLLTGISRELYSDNRSFVTFLLGEGPNFRS
jgi:hypothetical protein